MMPRQRMGSALFAIALAHEILTCGFRVTCVVDGGGGFRESRADWMTMRGGGGPGGGIGRLGTIGHGLARNCMRGGLGCGASAVRASACGASGAGSSKTWSAFACPQSWSLSGSSAAARCCKAPGASAGVGSAGGCKAPEASARAGSAATGGTKAADASAGAGSSFGSTFAAVAGGSASVGHHSTMRRRLEFLPYFACHLDLKKRQGPM